MQCSSDVKTQSDASHCYGQINTLIQIQNTYEIMIDFIYLFF
jgi:hypothetical protein